MSDHDHPTGQHPDDERPGVGARVWRFLIGAPRTLSDTSIMHRLSLVPFLAWIGLGADGLSSSAYGPEEAFRTLGSHTYLAVVLAAVMIFTIFLISAAYSRIIEEFPHGGGGYVVATRLLGEGYGVASGSALLVDYVLTITISIAAAGDALFSLLPLPWHVAKLPVEVLLIVLLTTLNIRGVRESVLALAPIFLMFLVTHALLIGGGILGHLAEFPATVSAVQDGFSRGGRELGGLGMLVLLVHAYSLGGGTYTGIEAVSNGLQIMREPRVRTAKRTMTYLATSLAFTATGLFVCYLLWGVGHEAGKTMNAVLAGRVMEGFPFSGALVVATLVSEGALLVVAAQAGFLDGPRVLANMALDSWVPHRFAALSDRLTTLNGIMLMGLASMAALLLTGGNVRAIVVMYSINVFLTFSLSMLGMTRSWIRGRKGRRHWRRRTALFLTGFMLCATILGVTVVEKFGQGGWVTLAVTGSVMGLCFVIRRHYRKVAEALSKLYAELDHLPPASQMPPLPAPDPTRATAAVLVGSYGGLGIHTTLNLLRAFPDYFVNLVFVSVGVIDTGAFKGEDTIDELRAETEAMLGRYVNFAQRLGLPATSRMAVGTDAIDEAEALCLDVQRDFPKTTFFAGKVIFQREHFYQRMLHNETAFALQRRLQWAGQTLVILPARVL